jgi:hypothetical protein
MNSAHRAKVSVTLLSILFTSVPSYAAIIHQSATMGPTGQTYGYILSSEQFIGSRFQVNQQVQVTAIGGHLLAGSGSIFGAIISLSNMTSLPDGSPFYSSEVVASKVFTPNPVSSDFRTSLSVTLEPGAYALVFGAGEFGSGYYSTAYMPYGGQSDLPGSSYFAWIWDGWEMAWVDVDASGARFVVEGMVTGYCQPSGSCGYEYIKSVQVGSINNSTGCTTGGYADYTSLTTNMLRETGYPITVTTGNPYPEDQLGLWVDWNQDKDFDDASETITVTGTPASGLYSATITPPAGVLAGNTRMRVRVIWDVTPSPCGYYPYSEAEDYTIVVTAAPTQITISGYVKTLSGTAIEGVLVTASTGQNDTTDSAGFYELTAMSPWSVIVTPGKAEWVFTPVNRAYTNITSNQTNQNFTGKYSYCGGNGTAENPYLICTAEQMNSIGLDPCDWNKHFKLTADIDLAAYTGTSFNMIGRYEPIPTGTPVPFYGVFDGDGHSISNFTYTSADACGVGIFSIVGELDCVAEIKNLTMVDPNIDAGTGHLVGAIVGDWHRTGNMSNCHVVGGHVKGGKYIGGLIGTNMYCTVTQCSSSADITATDSEVSRSGGLIGFNLYGNISQCCSSGTVTVSGEVGGGLIGYHGWDANPTITDCYSSATVTGETAVGGLVGESTAPIVNCYAVGPVSGTGQSVHGLVGVLGGSGGVANSFWDINTTNDPGPGAGTGLPTAQMQTLSTFIDAGWDFVDETANGTEDIWRIREGRDYPRLSWEPEPPPDDITLTIDLSSQWMYQNLPNQTKSNITAEINEFTFNDPAGNGDYTFYWEIELPDDVTVEPITVSGGGEADISWMFAAPSCNDPGGLSDSGQTFKVRVTVVGSDFGNSGIAEMEFAIGLLGDVDNNTFVNVADRSIINTFWKTGAAGPYTLKDCDLNCDGVVNVADRSIANSIWRGVLGANSITVPCPLR